MRVGFGDNNSEHKTADNIQLRPSEYVVKIKGIEVARGEVMISHYLAMNTSNSTEEVEGIETREAAFGLPALWIAEKEKERAELLGYTVVDPPTVIATHLTEVIKKHSHELMGRQHVQMLLDNVRKPIPYLWTKWCRRLYRSENCKRY